MKMRLGNRIAKLEAQSPDITEEVEVIYIVFGPRGFSGSRGEAEMAIVPSLGSLSRNPEESEEGFRARVEKHFDELRQAETAQVMK